MPRHRFGIVALSFGFALIQSRIILLAFGMTGYMASVDIVFGVTTGHPYWRECQSRVLSPYAVKAIALLTHSHVAAHILFGILMLTLAGCVAWNLGEKVGGDTKSALISFLAMQMGFTSLLSPHWLYAWDFTGLVLFLVFVIFVAESKRWPWFVALFSVAILNRESAEFIALWMVLDPLIKRRNWTMFAAGACCGLAGVGLTMFLQSHLLVAYVDSILFPLATALQSIRTEASYNVRLMLTALQSIRTAFQMAPLLLFPAGVVCFAIMLSRRDPQRWLALSLVVLANLAACLLRGDVSETRQYLELLPFVMLGVVVFCGPQKASALQLEQQFTSRHAT